MGYIEVIIKEVMPGKEGKEPRAAFEAGRKPKGKDARKLFHQGG